MLKGMKKKYVLPVVAVGFLFVGSVLRTTFLRSLNKRDIHHAIQNCE